MFIGIMSSLGKIISDFFSYKRRKASYSLSDSEVLRFLDYCNIIAFRINNDDLNYRNEIVLHLLQIYFWDFYVSLYIIISIGYAME